jgi:flavin reductase (DIM6/NTAB) family NADH-FMN oxidoreductase RutF
VHRLTGGCLLVMPPRVRYCIDVQGGEEVLELDVSEAPGVRRVGAGCLTAVVARLTGVKAPAGGVHYAHRMATALRTPLVPLPLSKVYALIEPGPVVLLTTAAKGRANVMTMSWHMMVEFEPPRIACVVSDANHSFAALSATGECVIAIPARKLATQVVGVGNSSGRDTDKLKAFGLTPAPAACVAAPLIAECFANLECKVIDRTLVRKYSLFILEVLKAWIDPSRKSPRTLHHRGYGTFAVDGPIIHLPSRMR